MTLRRRELLAVALAPVLPAVAAPEAMHAAIAAFAAGAPLHDGRVRIEIAALVENGNTVPLAVAVDSPMTPADHVAAIGVYTQANPQPDVAVFHLSPRAGRARVATRIRLATSQQVAAVARMSDGSCWIARVDVVVTLAACVES